MSFTVNFCQLTSFLSFTAAFLLIMVTFGQRLSLDISPSHSTRKLTVIHFCEMSNCWLTSVNEKHDAFRLGMFNVNA